jgi:hypothetical protein
MTRAVLENLSVADACTRAATADRPGYSFFRFPPPAVRLGAF